MNKQQLFIGGHWVNGKEYENLRSPYHNEVIASIPVADPEEVEQAIQSAYEAQQSMHELSAFERAQILERVSDLFEQRLEECASILAKENAKPLKAARGEIFRTMETYKFAAEEAKSLHGETVPLDAAKSGKGRFGYTKKEPLGVIAAITPFNFPFNLTAHKLGAAFAAGNTVVHKPASQTPLSALMTARIFEEAGLPAGALNVITGKGRSIGDALVTDPRVNMVTFTGSVPVGTAIKEKAGLKRVTLELGSNAAVIVNDADNIEEVANRCVEGSFNFAGQVCISIQRIFVHEELFDRFVDKLREKANSLVLGDPENEDTDISALIHSSETNRIEEWINEAKEQGAQVLTGGRREGTVYAPTIIAHTKATDAVSCQEAFGPVVTVNPYRHWDEAIDFVNDSEYGLQAGVYTQLIEKAFDATNRLHVGGVIVNDIPSFRVDNMPYGGVKNSGTGKEGIKYSVEEMTELKFVSFKL